MGRRPRAAASKRPRKRRRRGSAGAPNSFSRLPDDVLLHIASHLTTRAAVQLSCLARRFRHLPTLFDRVGSLSLSVANPAFPPRATTRPFLLRRLALSPPRKARPSDLRPVLDVAANHGLSELAICLKRRVPLPRNVLTIRSLTVLSLRTCAVSPRFTGTVAFDRLHTLKLRRVAVHQETITTILAAAPVLETLEMVYCTGFGRVVTVESSSVRNFLFKPALEQRAITLRAAGLRTVVLFLRPRIDRVHLEPAPEVRKVYLHTDKAAINEFRVRPLLDAGTRLVYLVLTGFATMMLSSEYQETPKLAVTFQDLRKLSVSLDFSNGLELGFLLKLLESCPSLQQLNISTHETNKDASPTPSFTDHEDRLSKLPCLTESLVHVKFLRFRPQQYENKLVNLLLTQARKLKKMEVQFPDSQEADVREILSVKRAPIERISTLHGEYYLVLEYS